MSLNISLFLIILITSSLVQRTFSQNATNKSLTSIVESLGYPVEVHEVTTQDGYIVALHRIPKSPKATKKGSKGKHFPLLLVHGLGVSGSMYIVPIPGINNGIAYMLSDAGYDIWILHARGTHLSMKHPKLSPNKKKYWDFSWHEIGLYDVTSSINYILKKTRAPKIHYIGLSQGTTAFLVALSLRPEYNQKISSSYLMVPPGSVAHISGIAKYLIEAGFANKIADTIENGHFYFLPLRNDFLQESIKIFCGDKVRFTLCLGLVDFGIGHFDTSLDLYKLFLELLQMADNIGVKQVRHYMQNSQKKRFQQYDYGKVKNMKIYKSTKPPLYNLTNIEVPITLMSAKFDNLATEKDVLVLKSKLKNARLKSIEANHVDFLLNSGLLDEIVEDIIQFNVKNS